MTSKFTGNFSPKGGVGIQNLLVNFHIKEESIFSGLYGNKGGVIFSGEFYNKEGICYIIDRKRGYMRHVIKQVRKLRGGESENLSQNYWKVHAKVMSLDADMEDMYQIWKNDLDGLTEEEEVYLYWDLHYCRQMRNWDNVELMQILIRRHWNDRMEEINNGKA